MGVLHQFPVSTFHGLGKSPCCLNLAGEIVVLFRDRRCDSQCRGAQMLVLRGAQGGLTIAWRNRCGPKPTPKRAWVRVNAWLRRAFAVQAVPCALIQSGSAARPDRRAGRTTFR